MIPGKELTIRCMDTGTYSRAVLTEGQGGTFIEMEAGNDPATCGPGSRSQWRASECSAAGSSMHSRGCGTRRKKWAILDSNQGPLPYQRSSLTD